MSNKLIDNKELMKEWNYEKNIKYKPDELTLGSSKKVWWKCKNGHEYQRYVYNERKGNGKCPFCEGRSYKKLSETEKLEKKAKKYKQKIKEKSNGNIVISNYKNARENVNAKCLNCNYEWNIRADHLIERCYCPQCKND